MSSILSALTQGDLRTTGVADTVAKKISQDQLLFDEVFEGLYSDDPGLRMRCADALEKASIINPSLLTRHKTDLLEKIITIDQQEVQWHWAAMISRIQLTEVERNKVVRHLDKLISHSQSRIVQTFALQSLTDLTSQDKELKPFVVERIKLAMKHGSPAVVSRGKRLLQQLNNRS